MKQRWLRVAGACAAVVAHSVAAQSYPSKPVRVLMSFPPGSIVETITRQINQEITKASGQPVVLDNSPGGNGIISADGCAKAERNGHTVCLIDRTLPLLPLLYVNSTVNGL